MRNELMAGLGTNVPDPLAEAATQGLKPRVRAWASHCSRYRGGDDRRAMAQLIGTVSLLAVLFIIMIRMADISYVIILLLAVPAGGLLIRIFIIQHDCGHGSFFKSRAANDQLGRMLSVLTLAPYGLWRREHATHHKGSGNLDCRGVGDIETLTVEEYKARNFFGRANYRIYRNPIFLFGIGVPTYFLLIQRLPWFHGEPAREAWKSVAGLNAALLLLYGCVGWFLGYLVLLLVTLPMVVVAASVGGWLFFMQHQFEHTYWARYPEWDFHTAAVLGSSYYDLPRIFQWFTGNIGLHHIHHLNSMIPNYKLQECLDSLPELRNLNRISLWHGFSCVSLVLWCERKRRLVTFKEALSEAH